MKILLTGDQGFIGKNFKEKLTDLGHEIVGYDFAPMPPMDDDGKIIMPSLDGIDQVIHLGAEASTTAEDVEYVLNQNYQFSYDLLMMCCEAGINMQYASSASVYGPVTPWQEIHEGYVPRPQNLYGWSKYLFDRIVLRSIDKLPIKVQGFRYFNVWGHYENQKYEQASLFHKWVRNDSVIKVFDQSNRFYRDFVHVDDVFNLQYAMLDKEESGIYNIGTGRSTEIMGLAEDISKMTGKSIEVIEMPHELVRHYQKYTCADNTKILNATGNQDYKFITLSDVDNDLRVLP